MGEKYKRNYLTQVIVRLDFLSPLSLVQESLPKKIAEVSSRFFPIPEPKDVLRLELQMPPDSKDMRGKEINTKEWNFFDKNREKRLVITPEFMFVEFLSYNSYKDLSEHFFAISNCLFETFSEMQVKRFGLRYINNIEMSGSNVFNWSTYLNRNLLCIFNILSDNSRVTRAFHNFEQNIGDFVLRFQYGMSNPDYPALIKRKIFVLDYDAYTSSLLTKEEIIQTLPLLHDEIENLFEKSITDNLRKKMNAD